MKFSNLLLTIFIVGLLTAHTFSQSGINAAEPELLDEDQQFTISFHQPVLNAQSKTVRISGTDTVRAGEALSEKEIKAGFKVGDRIIIRIKAPVECYVYVVNNSQWDGSVLVNKGIELKAGRERDFIYKLTNAQGNTAVGTEELIFLIRRNPSADAEINRSLIKSNNALPKIKLDNTKTEENKSEITKLKTSGKTAVVIKVGCKVAAIFFPWIGGMCKLAGFGAAESENLPDDAIGISPAKDAENMVVQFAFPVKP